MATDATRRFHLKEDYFKDVMVNWAEQLHRAHLPAETSGLDIGCGPGAYSTQALAQVARKVIGMDVDAKAIDEARENLAKWLEAGKEWGIPSIVNSDIAFEVGSAEKLRFSNESFDVVTSRGGLRHCEDYRAAFAEAVRVLKRGGLFLTVEVVMPARLVGLWNQIDSAQGRREHYWEYPELLNLLHDSALDDIQIRPRRFRRILETFAEPIADNTVRARLLDEVKRVAPEYSNALGFHKDEQGGTVFYYHTLEITAKKRI